MSEARRGSQLMLTPTLNSYSSRTQPLFRRTQWQAEVLKRTKNRVRPSVMAVDKAGTAVLMMRYVAPIPFPARIGSAAANQSLMRRLAWFVSHVPFVEDDNLASERDDVWTTAADFLRLGAGDQEEHACLLAGYFLHMGQVRTGASPPILIGGRDGEEDVASSSRLLRSS